MSCMYIDNIGESICYAGGGNSLDCIYIDTISDGIKSLIKKEADITNGLGINSTTVMVH